MSESVKDIVREIRAWTVDTDGLAPEEVSLNVSAFADRIEAAYNREKDSYKDTIKPWCDKVGVVKMETTTDENSVVGNNAKIREALKAVTMVGFPHNFQREAPHIRGFCYDIAKAIEKCYTALAEPPRNCDIGTASDMAQRFKQFCHEHCSLDKCCDECPLKLRRAPCEFEWARMPYKKGETDEQK